jgi:hypothetical protein
VGAAVRAQVLGNTTSPSQFITVAANGDSPESSKRLVIAAAQVIVDDHRKRFDVWMARLGVFREQSDRQIAAALEDFRTKPTVSAPAVLLMRAQLEEKQSQLLGFLREQRDLDVNPTVQSERTVVVAAPLVPKGRMRRRRTITTLDAAVSRFVLAVLWAVASDARRGSGRIVHGLRARTRAGVRRAAEHGADDPLPTAPTSRDE